MYSRVIHQALVRPMGVLAHAAREGGSRGLFVHAQVARQMMRQQIRLGAVFARIGTLAGMRLKMTRQLASRDKAASAVLAGEG